MQSLAHPLHHAKFFTLTIIAAVFTTLSTGCALLTGENITPQVTWSANDNGKSIALYPGEAVQINLESNPSTGFSWEYFIAGTLSDGSASSSVVIPAGQKFTDGGNDGNLVGVPGTQTYFFKALRKGTATIDLYYYRPWETLDKNDAEHVSFTIRVR